MGAFKEGDKVRFQIFVSGERIGWPRWNIDRDNTKHFSDKLDWLDAEVSICCNDISWVNTIYTNPYSGEVVDYSWPNKEFPEREGYIQHANKIEKATIIHLPIDMSDLVARVYICGGPGVVKARAWAVEQFAPAIKRRLREWPKCECGCLLELDADYIEDGNEWVLRPVFKCKCKES